MDEKSKAVFIGTGLLNAATMAEETGDSQLNNRKEGRERAKLFYDFADRLRARAASGRVRANFHE